MRGRLTIWNTGLLAITLILFGLVLNFMNQRRLSDEIDRDLLNRARQAANPPPRPAPPPAPNGGQPFGGEGPNGAGGQDGFQGPDGRPFGGGQGGPPEDINGLPKLPGPDGPPGEPLAHLGRPEILDLKGRVVAPRNSKQVFDTATLAEAFRGKETLATTKLGDLAIRVAAVPVIRHGRVIGAVETARELTDFQSLWQGQMATLFLLVPLALLAAWMGALFLVNKALKPIGEATATASQISEQDLSGRLDVRGADELAQLPSTFNSMLDRLEVSFARQKVAYAELEKSYEHQRRFTGDASHELRTPLTRLKLATSAALSQSHVPEAIAESLRIADQSAEAMSRIVQQLLLLSKADAGQLGLVFKPVNLRVVVAEAADSLGGRQIDLVLPETPLTVEGDEDHLRRVLVNLLQNSVRHTKTESPVSVSVSEGGSTAMICVRDAGEGIASEHLSHLGERFYRVDHARSREEGGFGLGLSICRSIVDAHNGNLSIKSQFGKGTEVLITLPKTHLKPTD